MNSKNKSENVDKRIENLEKSLDAIQKTLHGLLNDSKNKCNGDDDGNKMSLVEKSTKDIIENLEFEKIHSVMEKLNWKWYTCSNRVPEVSDLKNQVRDMIRDCFVEIDKIYYDGKGERNYHIETGGFSVTIYQTINEGFGEDPKTNVHVKFVLSDWEYRNED